MSTGKDKSTIKKQKKGEGHETKVYDFTDLRYYGHKF